MAPLGSSKAELHPDRKSTAVARLPLDKMLLYLEASINFLDVCPVSDISEGRLLYSLECLCVERE
jgi:hypothetical protein